ncbi:hypothetical protein CJO94_12105 [Ralstonia solanacearum]|nr:hypothetical protein CJO94_12105 [Ralstonia solanacearum]
MNFLRDNGKLTLWLFGQPDFELSRFYPRDIGSDHVDVSELCAQHGRNLISGKMICVAEIPHLRSGGRSIKRLHSLSD